MRDHINTKIWLKTYWEKIETINSEKSDLVIGAD